MNDTDIMMEDEKKTKGKTEKGAQTDMHGTREIGVKDMMTANTRLLETVEKNSGEKDQQEMRKQEKNTKTILRNFYVHRTMTIGK